MDFPTFAPSSRVYTHGEWPVSRHKFMTGRSQQMLHANGKGKQRLRLRYDNAWLGNLDYFIAHFNRQRGTHTGFYLTAKVMYAGWDGIKGTNNDNRRFGFGLKWRYSKPPRIRSQRGKYGTIEIELETVGATDTFYQPPGVPEDCLPCPGPPVQPRPVPTTPGEPPDGTAPPPDVPGNGPTPGPTPSPPPTGPGGGPPPPTPPGPGDPADPEPIDPFPDLPEGSYKATWAGIEVPYQITGCTGGPTNADPNNPFYCNWAADTRDKVSYAPYAYWHNPQNDGPYTDDRCGPANQWLRYKPVEDTEKDACEEGTTGASWDVMWGDNQHPYQLSLSRGGTGGTYCSRDLLGGGTMRGELYPPYIIRMTNCATGDVYDRQGGPPTQPETTRAVFKSRLTGQKYLGAAPRVTNSVLDNNYFPNISPSRRRIVFGDYEVDRYGSDQEVTMPLPSTAQKNDVVMTLVYANRKDEIARMFMDHYDQCSGEFYDFPIAPVDAKGGTFAGWDDPDTRNIRRGRWIYTRPPRIEQTAIGHSTTTIEILNLNPALIDDDAGSGSGSSDGTFGGGGSSGNQGPEVPPTPTPGPGDSLPGTPPPEWPDDPDQPWSPPPVEGDPEGTEYEWEVGFRLIIDFPKTYRCTDGLLYNEGNYETLEYVYNFQAESVLLNADTARRVPCCSCATNRVQKQIALVEAVRASGNQQYIILNHEDGQLQTNPKVFLNSGKAQIQTGVLLYVKRQQVEIPIPAARPSNPN